VCSNFCSPSRAGGRRRLPHLDAVQHGWAGASRADGGEAALHGLQTALHTLHLRANLLTLKSSITESHLG